MFWGNTKAYFSIGRMMNQTMTKDRKPADNNVRPLDCCKYLRTINKRTTDTASEMAGAISCKNWILCQSPANSFAHKNNNGIEPIIETTNTMLVSKYIWVLW